MLLITAVVLTFRSCRSELFINGSDGCWKLVCAFGNVSCPKVAGSDVDKGMIGVVAKVGVSSFLRRAATLWSNFPKSRCRAKVSMAFAGPLQRITPEMNSSNVTSPSPLSNKWNKAAPSCTSISRVAKYAFTFGLAKISVSRDSVRTPSSELSMEWKVVSKRSTYSAFLRILSKTNCWASLFASSNVSLRKMAEITRMTAKTMIVT
mmetsp:Transcript_59271/g.130080  ORF Transcript_59271/g.130080 Transcript_59271/m.130080 type:complete len:206 (-) Transcript_59271:1512-2129(-)